MKNTKFCIIIIAAITYLPLLHAMNEEKFQTLKEDGNRAFESKNYQLAIDSYSKALKIKQCPIVLRNRALTYNKTKQLRLAEEDLILSLRLNKNDQKTLYWTGTVKLAQKKNTEAVYYFNKAKEAGNRNVESLLETAKNNYLTIVENAYSASKRDVSERIIANLISTGQEHGFSNISKIRPLYKNLMDEKEYFYASVEIFNKEKLFRPVNVGEYPQKLATFIGKGQRVATVLVQTLPIYLAYNFKEVHVFDIAPAQIYFQKQILECMENKDKFPFGSFITNAQNDLLMLVKKHENLPYKVVELLVNKEFEMTYGPLLLEPKPTNIKFFEEDIFKNINKKLEEKIAFDSVFISTIPGDLNNPDWHSTYSDIRRWLEQGVSVVFSIVPMHVIYNEWKNELISSFDDVATKELAMFDETIGTIHVKLSPKPKN